MTVNVKIPENMDSKFRFVLVAAHRAEQLMRGARPHDGIRNKKLTSIAQHEVGDGLVRWEYTQPLANEVVEEEAAAEDEAEAVADEAPEADADADGEDEEDVN